MNVQQKVAWFNLAVFGASVVAYLVLARVMGPLPAIGAFGLCGLWGLEVFIHGRGLAPLFHPRRKLAAALDERDRLIQVRSQLTGLWVFWGVFIAACMVTWGVLRFGKRQYTVPVDVLPWMTFGAAIIFRVSHSVAVLVQYGRTGRESE